MRAGTQAGATAPGPVATQEPQYRGGPGDQPDLETWMHRHRRAQRETDAEQNNHKDRLLPGPVGWGLGG